MGGLDGIDDRGGSGGEGITGLVGGGVVEGLISLVGKLGGILISGVKGLAVLSETFNRGLGGVVPLGGRGDEVAVDPEIGGLISSAI